jgi:excisionase family DNA binding protein
MSAVADKSYFSYRDLEQRWGVSRWTIHRLAKEGRLRKSRVRGVVRFSAATVMAFEKKAG